MAPPNYAGQRPAPSTTVHLTEKKVPGQMDRAMVRRATIALAEVSGMQTKNARRIVDAYASGSLPIAADGWSAWLRDWHGIADPTGETAARNLDRDKGLAARLQATYVLRGGDRRG